MAGLSGEPGHKSLWEAAGRFLFVLALAAGLAWIVRDNLLPTHDRNQELSAELERARRLLSALEKEREALVREIHALESDPFYVEYLLRTRFGFRRPGEVVLEDRR